jgi:aryl-alcohol dehydrogenase-like predicted oxidoreductase
MAYLPYFPLASGLLTGKYRRGQPPAPDTRLDVWYDERERAEVLTDTNFDRLDRLGAFAEERGHTLLELAFAWLLAQGPIASVIAGATSPDQIHANAAAGGWRLDPADLELPT